MIQNYRVLWCGRFIGGHLILQLRRQGFDDVENLVLNLKELSACRQALQCAQTDYNLPGAMRGIGSQWSLSKGPGNE
jgi:hypothetical protein